MKLEYIASTVGKTRRNASENLIDMRCAGVLRLIDTRGASRNSHYVESAAVALRMSAS